MIKIIFLIDSTFSDRDYNRYGLDIMINRGVDIEFWDFSLLRNKTVFFDQSEKKVLDLKKKLFKDFKELKTASKELKSTFIIDLRIEFYKHFPISWFKKHGAITILLDQGLLPASNSKHLLIKRLLLFRLVYKEYSIKELFLKGKNFLSSFIKKDNRVGFDIKVCSGQRSQCEFGEFEIRSHAMDYDIFFRLKDKETSLNGTAVFIDNGVTEHPDFLELGTKNYCTPEKYFPSINNFFDIIENQFGLKVIIASHPRIVDTTKLERHYNRKVICGSTAELVMNSSLVFSHASTAVNFAVLWKKPLLIISTEELEKRLYLDMSFFCDFLAIERINIDCFDMKTNFKKLAEKPIESYNYYRNELIKVAGTPEKHSCDILLDGLENYV